MQTPIRFISCSIFGGMARRAYIFLKSFLNITLFVVSGVFLLLSFVLPQEARAAQLSLSPSSAAFTVGSTFDVDILLNTDGQSINALQVFVKFPPDKMQLVSPSTGKSIIGVWTSPPQFNNQKGIIELQGGIPNGINVERGLLTRLTFRARKTGTAILQFSDKNRVLLNDGKGTDALEQTQNGVYQLLLPPPAGPIVASETHPEAVSALA